jgi:hypothetical protein
MIEVFQEKHTTGHLWWKLTYYKYFRYFEGNMLQVTIYSKKTLQELEK